MSIVDNFVKINNETLSRKYVCINKFIGNIAIVQNEKGKYGAINKKKVRRQLKRSIK